MCGRYSIYESMDHYLKELAPKQLVINGGQRAGWKMHLHALITFRWKARPPLFRELEYHAP